MNEALPILRQTTWMDLIDSISLPESQVGNLPYSLPDGQKNCQLLQQVYPASHSAPQVQEKAKTTTGTCYRTLSNSLSNAIGQLFLENKCQGLSSTAGWMIYNITWEWKVTKLGLRYLQQRARAHRTLDNGCTGWLTGWATPNCMDTLPVRSDELGNTEHDGHVAVPVAASHVQPSAERRQDWQDFSGESKGAGGRNNAASLPGLKGGCGEWDNPDWICCRDNKHRPIKPGIKPLVDGLPKGMVRSSDKSAQVNADETSEARVMRLKGVR
jgi:hypothetical protein